MNYSDNPGMVRVDYFKTSGKWYMTEAIDMSPWYTHDDLFKAVDYALRRAWEQEHGGRANGWEQFTVVVLEPYHQSAHPVMIKAKEAEAHRAPVQLPRFKKGSVAWWEHEEAYVAYSAKYGRQQSAERLAERGGFHLSELTTFLGHEPTTLTEEAP